MRTNPLDQGDVIASSPNRAATAVFLIVVGVMAIAIGAWTWSTCSSLPSVNGVAPSCGGSAIVVLFGFLLLVIGIVVAVVSARGGRRTIYPSTDPAIPPPLIQPVVVQQTVVEQTVEVRCRYCQSLNPVTATKCSACGAAL
jgi:ribosomal protein L40E